LVRIVSGSCKNKGKAAALSAHVTEWVQTAAVPSKNSAAGGSDSRVFTPVRGEEKAHAARQSRREEIFSGESGSAAYGEPSILGDRIFQPA
jgi:hypothetical protein